MSNEVVVTCRWRPRRKAVQTLDLGNDQRCRAHEIGAGQPGTEAGPGPGPEQLRPSVLGISLNAGQRIGGSSLGQIARPVAAVLGRQPDLVKPLPLGNDVVDGLAQHASAPPKAWPTADSYNLPLSAERGTKTDPCGVATGPFGVTGLQ